MFMKFKRWKPKCFNVFKVPTTPQFVLFMFYFFSSGDIESCAVSWSSTESHLSSEPFLHSISFLCSACNDFTFTKGFFFQHQPFFSRYLQWIQWANQLVPCIDKTWSDSGAIKIKIRNKNEPWSAPDGIKEETTESSPHESFLQADRPQMINLKKLWWWNIFVFVFVFVYICLCVCILPRKKCWKDLDDNNTLHSNCMCSVSLDDRQTTPII